MDKALTFLSGKGYTASGGDFRRPMLIRFMRKKADVSSRKPRLFLCANYKKKLSVRGIKSIKKLEITVFSACDSMHDLLYLQ